MQNTDELFEAKRQVQLQRLSLLLSEIVHRSIKEAFDLTVDNNGTLRDAKGQVKAWRFLNTLENTYKHKLKEPLSILQQERVGEERIR